MVVEPRAPVLPFRRVRNWWRGSGWASKLGLHLNDENVVLFIAEGGLAYAEGTLRVGDRIIG